MDVEGLLKSLKEHKVRFVIIGATAFPVHGYSRATLDIDVFIEPTRHFRFTDEGITNEVAGGRRSSSYFVPIARPRKKGQKQLEFDTEWTQDRIEENKLVN